MSKQTEKKEDKKALVNDREKKMQELVGLLRKEHGEGAVFHGDMPVKDIETLPSGSLTLDLCMGVGGYPYGRIVEIMGPEASGKTTLTLHLIASAQKEGKNCAFVDAEHALDTKYAKQIGIDVDSLIISQPDSGEQALDIVKTMAASGAIDVIVVDSVAALVPKAELEGDFDKAHMGNHARLMSKAMRMLTHEVSKNNVLVVFINQYRNKIGVMYGDPRTTTGGDALKYYASMRLAVRPGEKFKEGDRVFGAEIIVKMSKNKMAPPFTECAVPLIYGQGIDQVGDIYTMAKELEVLQVRGAHHYLVNKEGVEEKLASKKEEMIELLRKDHKLLNELEKRVRSEWKKRLLDKGKKEADAGK
jgi:recombination protein RecA